MPEKTGLMALAGTIKGIDNDTIPKGSRVLTCITSGMTDADGKAAPEFRIPSLASIIKDYAQTVCRTS